MKATQFLLWLILKLSVSGTKKQWVSFEGIKGPSVFWCYAVIIRAAHVEGKGVISGVSRPVFVSTWQYIINIRSIMTIVSGTVMILLLGQRSVPSDGRRYISECILFKVTTYGTLVWHKQVIYCFLPVHQTQAMIDLPLLASLSLTKVHRLRLLRPCSDVDEVKKYDWRKRWPPAYCI